MADARYNAAADFYAQGWLDTYDDAASVALLSVLGTVHGLRVLDVACGHGRYTRELARRGASPVLGLDISSEQIARARDIEAAESLGVTYVCSDLASSGEIPDRSFDRVFCGFGLSDVDDLDGALATVSRVLTVGGRFVFCILHPCFPGAEGVSGSWPPDGNYYDERLWFADGSASTLRHQVGANHRTLSTYVNSLIAHGLVIERVSEPEPTGQWALDWPKAATLPGYLAVSCTKV